MSDVEIEVTTLDFKDLWSRAVKNVWKLVDILKFQFIYYKVITQRGLEFDRLREYTTSDDARFIDWNSYARTGKPHVKVFKEERKLNIIFVVDVSTTMALGTTELTKNQYASILTTTLALTSINLGDKASLIAFSDRIKTFIDPSISVDTVLQIGKTLCKPDLWGGPKDWKVITHPILETFPQDSFVFIISDFIGEKKYMYDFVLKAANHFEGVAGIMVRDPLDSYIPEGIGKMYVQDPDTGEVTLIDADDVRLAYNRKVKREEEKIKEKFMEAGALYVKTLTTNKDIVRLILDLFRGA